MTTTAERNNERATVEEFRAELAEVCRDGFRAGLDYLAVLRELERLVKTGLEPGGALPECHRQVLRERGAAGWLRRKPAAKETD